MMKMSDEEHNITIADRIYPDETTRTAGHDDLTGTRMTVPAIADDMNVNFTHNTTSTVLSASACQ
jgi:hypothetical protein